MEKISTKFILCNFSHVVQSKKCTCRAGVGNANKPQNLAPILGHSRYSKFQFHLYNLHINPEFKSYLFITRSVFLNLDN